jgi:hypothetical protein
MSDPNQRQNESNDSLGEAADNGGEIATEGIVEMAFDGVTATAEMAGEVVLGVLTSID